MLSQAVQEAQVKVHEALLDNINTGAALDALSGLIKATNQYLAAKQAAAGSSEAAAAGNEAAAAAGLAAGGPQPLLLRKAAAFVTRILSVFGLLQVCWCAAVCLAAAWTPREETFCHAAAPLLCGLLCGAPDLQTCCASLGREHMSALLLLLCTGLRTLLLVVCFDPQHPQELLVCYTAVCVFAGRL